MSRSQADHSEFLKDEYARCWVGGLNGENPFTVYHGSSHQDESFKYLTILFGNYTFTKAKKKKKKISACHGLRKGRGREA